MERNEIICFWKEDKPYGEFSQWYPCSIMIDGTLYKDCEQYMMSEKAKLFCDYNMFDKIMKANTPKEYKKLGRQIKNFNENTWNKYKLDIVFKSNYAKFTQHEKLKELLLNTGDKILIEASPFDPIWGVKLSESDDRILNKETWQGENLLGYTLMKVRDYIRNDNN